MNGKIVSLEEFKKILKDLEIIDLDRAGYSDILNMIVTALYVAARSGCKEDFYMAGKIYSKADMLSEYLAKIGFYK